MPRHSCLIVPFANARADARVLVAHTVLVQKSPGKTPSRRIPAHAGQWVLAGDILSSDRPDEAAAYEVFRARTGIDLTEPSAVGRYELERADVRVLEDAR